ncbi:hypothetical protein TPHA_0H03030 [Tetrapisispora phaffii CBS 4417]|uniref:Peroxisome assembly protein 22 n=1 Tax=Tetrapisispora phaffii (strain ATCC 24235 / CBS 4417 / NBRC 1672 / NRRL Y-8282 / UCD 70-5) TaxID=1071381 RepID=G8BWQ5_TETPH|nr:hypothetical protein TPHA_0H03030 [Tetrapisispora phaffii CBS 4417]CCE64506.1 hypothetical protein TPHA_0H03030 [Tetrapisispora phaffii CBS 4417]
MATRGNNRNNGFNLFIKSTCVLVGLGIAGYMWYRNAGNEERDADEELATNEKKTMMQKHSSIIILSTSLLKDTSIDWNSILENDCVILVMPGLKFDNLANINKSYKYKIIHCDTMTGIWSCIKHLRLNTLYYIKEELGPDYDDISVDLRNIFTTIRILDVDKDMNMQLT